VSKSMQQYILSKGINDFIAKDNVLSYSILLSTFMNYLKSLRFFNVEAHYILFDEFVAKE